MLISRIPLTLSMSLEARQQALIDDLNVIHDPHERLAAIVARAPKAGWSSERRRDDRLVPGCVSRVWLDGHLDAGGLCRFECDAESPMVKGLASLLCELYTGWPPSEVLAVQSRLWEALGLTKMLSPTRLNGLEALRRRIQELAAALIPDPNSQS